MGETILFYATSDDYGAFSNFAPYPITVRGKRWPTSEHFFQAQTTGDARIVEHTERDDFWGDGGDGSGANMLGRLLMELRDELRRDSSR
jgi:predicted NAD-dependent protein-ADP-ribosyltransferase YbiA (DUF1768 family)